MMRGPRCAFPRRLYNATFAALYHATFAAFGALRCVRSADPDIAIVLPLLEQIKRGDSACAPPFSSPCVRVCACCASRWGGLGERGCLGGCARCTFALRLCVRVCVRVRVRVRLCVKV